MKKYVLFILMISLGFGISCKEPERESQILIDIHYGPDERNIMDVYLPKGRKVDAPFIVLIHPGAWMSGEKALLSRLSDSLFQKGIVVANIHTRFVSDSLHLDAVLDDIERVLGYCKSKSEEWHTRDKHFAIGGSSSGGHLALMYAFTKAKPETIASVVSFAAPTNVADTAWIQAMIKEDIKEKIEWMVGRTYTAGTVPDSAFYSSSPIHTIQNIPCFIIHGDQDDVVPYRQATQLLSALESQAIHARLYTLKGMKHEIGMRDSIVFADEVFQIKEWLERYR